MMPMIVNAELLSEKGFVKLAGFLSREECLQFQAFFDNDAMFRSTINMQRYRFGRGMYKYFTYPLPQRISELRTELYEQLSPVANEWMKQLKLDVAYPPDHKSFLEVCKGHGQTRPTPLL